MGRGLGICVATVTLLGCHFRVAEVKPPDGGSPRDLALRPVDLASVEMRDLASFTRDLEEPGGGGPDLLPVTGEIDVAAPDAIPGMVDLSHEGLIDWAHCGYMNVAGVDDRRANGPAAITVGATSGTISAYTPFSPTFSWSDGTPTASVSTQSGVYMTGAGHGFAVSVPASTTPHTLRLYLDVFMASAQLTAHLSDGSAPDYVGQTIVAGSNNGIYSRFTIRFHAATAGQTLTVTWTMTADRGGSIDLLAATLY